MRFVFKTEPDPYESLVTLDAAAMTHPAPAAVTSCILSLITMPPGSPYSWMAPASSRALEPEKTAKDAFLAAKSDFEERVLPTLAATPGTSHTIALVGPECHLTSHTWETFNHWVEENDGWEAKRREATTEESAHSRAYNRGKNFFIDVVYTVPDPNKKIKTNEIASDEDIKPSAKEQRIIEPPKHRVGPFPFEQLHEYLQATVLSFVDVPGLGSLVRVSKNMNNLAMRDQIWAPHLKFLLQELYDESFGKDVPCIPISKRPNWHQSTDFFAWYQEMKATPHGNDFAYRRAWQFEYLPDFLQAPNQYHVLEKNYRWLFQDVPLRTYYKKAGTWASKLGASFWRMLDEEDRCIGCWRGHWECQCHSGTPAPRFGPSLNMPKIKLFFSNHSKCYECMHYEMLLR